MRFVWPLLVIGVPFVSSLEFVRAIDRFKEKYPEEYADASAKDLTRAEPRAWLLPAGVLIVGPILIVAGLVWLIWVLVSWAF